MHTYRVMIATEETPGIKLAKSTLIVASDGATAEQFAALQNPGFVALFHVLIFHGSPAD